MAGFDHIWAGGSLGLRYRRELASLVRTTACDCCIVSLDPERLKAEGITALALDFDGVLSPHGFAVPLPEAISWLERCSATFGDDKIFILSNKPTEERREWFQAHFPRLRFIAGVRKKPFPDGLQQIAGMAGVPLSSVLMVDDRLLTGCLGAIHSGARPCYIRKPYISAKHRPMTELFFVLLRITERMLVRFSCWR